VKNHPVAGQRKRAWIARVLVVLAALAGACLPAAAQNDNPLTPVPPRAVRKIPRESQPEAAPLPPEKIIESFAAREDEYLRAHTLYGFRRSIRLLEIDPSGEKAGEINQESEVYLADNGRRYERTMKENSQRFLDIKSGSVDAQKAAQVPLFPLVSSQLRYYDLTYKGSQPLDELHTYIFQVKPKRLLPHYRLFSGLIYVDDQDLAIVKLYGKWSALDDEDAEGAPTRDNPFSLYEMYYENVDEKYWFPTYIHSEAYVKTKGGEEQLRITVKMTNFKVAKPVAAPAEAAAPPAEPPKPPADQPAKPPRP
jgi:hypothetical protein